MSSLKIAPSILAADYACFAAELARIEKQMLNTFILISWTVSLCQISAWSRCCC